MVLTAVVIAGLASTLASHESFEAKLVRLEVQRELPALAPTLEQESPEINALFLSSKRLIQKKSTVEKSLVLTRLSLVD